MTHPIYTQTTLESLTTSQLKAIANQIGAIPDGDKRVKQTWVAAILSHQIMFSPAKAQAWDNWTTELKSRMDEAKAVQALEAETVIETQVEPVHPELIDTYIPTPRTHADDVALAAAMGMTYDDVFGEPMSEVDDIPAEEPLPEPTKKAEASHVFIALVAILYAVCVVPIGMGIVIYRGVRWGCTRFGNLTIQTAPLDYFPSPA